MSDRPTMQALVFDAPQRMRLCRHPIPTVAPGEVLVRVLTAGICGTDVRILSGRKTRDVRHGCPIGHECAGTVAAVGPGVTGLAVGDRVGLCPVVSCGTCEHCRADHENLCATRITLGYHTDGAFAEYMLIPAPAVQRGNLFQLPETVPLDLATLLEPMGCCINGQREMGLYDPPDSGCRRPQRLVIFGAGPIGLIHLVLAKAHGAAHAEWQVTVVEPRPNRREMAQKLGADGVLAPEAFPPAGNFDAAILAVGVTDLINVALRALRQGGRLNLFAGFDAGAPAGLDPNLIHYGQLRVSGASESRRRDFAEALNLVAAGRVRLEPLLTGRYPLAEHEAAFRAAADGTALKVAFTM